MRRNGTSTRLYHAIVGMGLSAAAAACGGQIGTRSTEDAVRDAADDAVSSTDATASSRDAVSVFGDDAPQLPDSSPGAAKDAAADAATDAGDGWVPMPPVIA